MRTSILIAGLSIAEAIKQNWIGSGQWLISIILISAIIMDLTEFYNKNIKKP